MSTATVALTADDKINALSNAVLPAWVSAMDRFFEQVDRQREDADLSDQEAQEALNRGYGYEIGDQWGDWADGNA
jgi:hypothetical protein